MITIMLFLLAVTVTKKVLDTMNFGDDVLAAIDQAISDGVYLIYVSTGGSTRKKLLKRFQ